MGDIILCTLLLVIASSANVRHMDMHQTLLPILHEGPAGVRAGLRENPKELIIDHTQRINTLSERSITAANIVENTD